MTLRTTIGSLLIDEALPSDMRGQHRVLDKKGVLALLKEVAETRPHDYREISKKLADVGHDAAFTTGGYSFGPESLRPSLAARKMRLHLGRELDQIYASPGLSDQARDEAILKTVGKYQAKLADEVYEEALAVNNPLARMVKSGTRGNKYNLNSLIGADLLYADHKGNPIPIPVLRSYSQGLTPMEYFAGAFGARKGTIDVKQATADAGFLGKQLVQAAHRLITTAHDSDEDYDVSHPRGLPVDTEHPGNIGAFLAHPTAGYARNTELTGRVLKDLRNKGHAQILVRSPLVGGPRDGGVYSRDVGRREKGGLAPIGDYVGNAAAQAISEPINQGQLGSKHSGGIVGAAGAAAVSGFKYINQMVNVPQKATTWATHAQHDGRVANVAEAPQGGHYIYIDGHKHYVFPGQKPTVKAGDMVEAGDPLSNGIGNPSQIVKHKGIGEGRRYFTHAFGDVLKESSTEADRRNIEILTRGLINHVRLTDEMGDYVPDDIVPYQTLEHDWEPRPGTALVSPTEASGKYLERPVLHYTIGTKIRPSVVKQLQQFGVQKIHAHPEPPPFEPEMVRAMAIGSHDTEWLPRMMSSYQSRSVLEAARRGNTSDELGTSYAAAIPSGTSFGLEGATKGWKPQGLG
jgi:DNA-directed RNA polymerase subunit beta'